MIDIGVTEENEWSALELNGNFCVTARQPLASTQINRDTSPPPIVDPKFKRDKGFRAGGGINTWFLTVTRKGAGFGGGAGPILATDTVVDHIFRAHGANRVQHFGLLVAHRIGSKRDRRLHCSESNQLHD